MKSENIEINKDGINVNKEKKIIYFLLEIDPLTFILFLIEFFISVKIIIKKVSISKMSVISNIFRFFSS